MAKKAALGILLALVVAGAAGAAYWRLRVKPWMLIEETRYGRIQGLGTAVIEFHDYEHRMPRSLKELVDARFLPEQSSLYGDPLQTGSMDRIELPYSQCQFEFQFSPDSVNIKVPDAVVQAFPHIAVPANRRAWTIAADLAVYSPRR